MIPAARQRLAWWQHALGVTAIFAACALRFYPVVTSVDPLGDELAQEAAFLQQAAGRSPYLDGGYVYPPSLMRLGALLHQLPLRSPFLPLRCASLAGLAVLLWCATAWLARGPWPRLGLALLFAMLAPGVRQGIEFGNLSFAVGGLIVLALLAWERAPVASGLLLGASLLIKPLALAALPALFFHRPKAGGTGTNSRSPSPSSQRPCRSSPIPSSAPSCAMAPTPGCWSARCRYTVFWRWPTLVEAPRPCRCSCSPGSLWWRAQGSPTASSYSPSPSPAASW